MSSAILPWPLRSTIKVRPPSDATRAPTCAVVVVFPTPPLPLHTTYTCPRRDQLMAGSGSPQSAMLSDIKCPPAGETRTATRMPDNAIRYGLARGAPWLTQCSGRDATRYAAPRRQRGFHTDGHANVTCNASDRNAPRSCAPSTAGRALDWIYGCASGGRTPSDWSLTSCL